MGGSALFLFIDYLFQQGPQHGIFGSGIRQLIVVVDKALQSGDEILLPALKSFELSRGCIHLRADIINLRVYAVASQLERGQIIHGIFIGVSDALQLRLQGLFLAGACKQNKDLQLRPVRNYSL